MSENQTPEQPVDGEAAASKQEQTFTQAEIDRIVRERVQRERAKYADYDDLKAKAGEKATAEERLAAVEKRAADAEARALRADIANRHGISAEDRELFLTGTDTETLTAQAERLANRDSERKKSNNFVPREGTNPSSGAAKGDIRGFTRQLFGDAN